MAKPGRFYAGMSGWKPIIFLTPGLDTGTIVPSRAVLSTWD